MTGRSPFKPTKAQRADVELLKADGWSDERIADLLGISRPTLLKHFSHELRRGRDKVLAENLRNLRKLAKKNSSAARLLFDRLAIAGTLRPDQSTPEEAPKLGKKEAAQVAAENPDTTTSMGGMMARRMAAARKLN